MTFTKQHLMFKKNGVLEPDENELDVTWPSCYEVLGNPAVDLKYYDRKEEKLTRDGESSFKRTRVISRMDMAQEKGVSRERWVL